MHILYVCTGNICRSPISERLTCAYARQNLVDPAQLTAASSGTRAVVGNPMHPTAERVLVGLGGDGGGFRARQLDADQVEQADLVLTLTRQHRSIVLNTSPRALPRTFTVREAQSLLASIPNCARSYSPDVTERGRRLVAEMARQRATRATDHGHSDDIADPIGTGEQTFLRIGDEISEALLPLLAACCGWPDHDDHR